MNLDRIYLKVTYNGKDITADLSRSLTSFTYTDSLKDADTLDLELEDSGQKWQNDWYPQKGAKLTAEIGIDGGLTVDCGTFEIDEINLQGPPDSVTIRAIAAGFKEGQTRTKKSHVHEGKTLAEIVKTVADAAGLKVQGKISDIRIGRMVQRQERDLRFLKRLATEYGYNFNVRDKTAIFIKNEELEGAKPVRSFKKEELINFSITDKSSRTYNLANVTFHNPETGETVSFTQDADREMNTDNALNLNYTAETKAQAMAMAKAALKQANNLQQTGDISLPGSPLLVSGNVIRLEGLGLLSGDYIIQSAAHSLANDTGWLVDAEINKVGYVEKDDSATTTNTNKSNANDTGDMGNFEGDTENMDFFKDK